MPHLSSILSSFTLSSILVDAAILHAAILSVGLLGWARAIRQRRI